MSSWQTTLDRWPDAAPAAASITFDGGYSRSLDAVRKIMEADAFPSTWFLVAGSVGGHLQGRAVGGWKDWRQMLENGQIEVGNHSLTHPALELSLRHLGRSLLSPPANWRRIRNPRATIERWRSRADVAGDSEELPPRELSNRPVSESIVIRDALEGQRVLSWQLDREISAFSYPNGRYTRRLAKALVESGHTSLRTTDETLNDPESLHPEKLGAMIWTVKVEDRDSENWVQRAIETGSWLIDVHHLVSHEPEYYWWTSPESLLRHVRRLRESRVWIATQSEVMNYVTSRKNTRLDTILSDDRSSTIIVEGERSSELTAHTTVHPNAERIEVSAEGWKQVVQTKDGNLRWILPPNANRISLRVA